MTNKDGNIYTQNIFKRVFIRSFSISHIHFLLLFYDRSQGSWKYFLLISYPILQKKLNQNKAFKYDVVFLANTSWQYLTKNAFYEFVEGKLLVFLTSQEFIWIKKNEFTFASVAIRSRTWTNIHSCFWFDSHLRVRKVEGWMLTFNDKRRLIVESRACSESWN